MSNTEHPVGGEHRSFRCTFEPVREVDLVWPPADEDIDAFRVVHLDDGDAQPPRVEPAQIEPPRIQPVRSEAVPPEPLRFEPGRIKPTMGDCRARDAVPRVRRLGVPREPPPPADPETLGAGRSAWLAVFFAAACVLLTFIEYRGLAKLPVDGSEAPVPEQVSVADVPAPVTPAVPPSALPKPAPPDRRATASPTRPFPAPTRKLARAPEPIRPAPRVTVDVRDGRIVAAAKVEPRVEVPPPPPPPPAPAPVAVAAARREPLANAAPSAPVISTPVGAVLTDTASDEAGIQSTLARFRTAYSQLNASAARDVWPSVDARALERAFQSLKSQDLRFDSCKMTVTGARAQAACKGRAVYVPRIGDQSPRFTSREWNFELRKADERWTIASARSL